MILNLEQLRSVTQGAAEVKKINGNYVFYRMSEAQRQYYADKPFLKYKRAHTAAGVRLVFRTDSTALSFFVEVSHVESRNFFQVEVFRDDERVACVGNATDLYHALLHDGREIPVDGVQSEDFPLGQWKCEVDLGTGEKTVRIELPWDLITGLNRVTLDDGASLIPVKPEKKIVFFGDSITQGNDTIAPSRSYASQVALHFGLEEFNYAVGAEHFCPKFVPLAADNDPDYVICAYGTNDWNSDTRETIVENSKKFYAAVAEKFPNAKVFALSPLWRKDLDTVKPSGAFRDLPRIIADAIEPYGNMTLIDCFDFIPKDSDYCSDLRLHPNEAGFAVYGENIIRELTPYIK